MQAGHTIGQSQIEDRALNMPDSDLVTMVAKTESMPPGIKQAKQNRYNAGFDWDHVLNPPRKSRAASYFEKTEADRIDGFDRDDLGLSP